MGKRVIVHLVLSSVLVPYNIKMAAAKQLPRKVVGLMTEALTVKAVIDERIDAPQNCLRICARA
jgi:threonine/homoserine efflux transporter RhtA